MKQAAELARASGEIDRDVSEQPWRGPAGKGAILPALLLALLLSFALRVYRLPLQSVWVDEGYSVDFASRGAAEMLNMWQAKTGFGEARPIGTIASRDFALAVDIHPPLFYFALHYWLLAVGTSEFAMRYLALISGMLVVALMFPLAARLFGRGVAVTGTLVAATAPFYVAYSQETRMYMPVTLFSLASTYWMLRALRGASKVQSPKSKVQSQGTESFRLEDSSLACRLIPWAAYVGTAAAALYTHYSAFLVLGFQNLWVLVALMLRRGRTAPETPTSRRPDFGLWTLDFGLARPLDLGLAAKWCVGQLCLLVVFAPWLGTALGQVNKYAVSLWTPNWQRELGDTLLTFAWGGAITVEPLAQPLAWLSRSLGALALLGVGLYAWRHPARRQSAAFAALYCGLSMALALLLFQLRPMFHPRYLMALTPPYYLLLALALVGLWQARRWAAAPLLALLLVVFAVGNYAYQFNADTYRDDTRSVAAYIASKATAGDVIFLDAPEPLSYYYHGPAPMYFIPGNETTTAGAITELARGHRRAFFLQWFQAGTDPLHVVPFLLEKYGRLLDNRWFHGYRLREYELPAGASYALAGNQRAFSANFDNLFMLESVAYGPGAEGQAERLGLMDEARAEGGGKLWVQLGWRLLRAVDRNYKAFVYLRDSQGHLAGQADLELDRDRFSTSRWPVDGAVVRNYYILPLEMALPPGEYQLEAGLYQAGQVQRLSALDANGSPAGSTVLIGKVRLVPASEQAVDPAAIPMARRLDRQMAEGLRLLGYDPPAPAIVQGETAHLALFWQAASPGPAIPYRLRLALEDGSGRRAELEARPLVSPSYPPERWRPGEVLRAWQDFAVPAGLAPGRYTLSVSLLDAAEKPLGQAVSLGQLEVRERARSFQPPAIAHPVDATFGDGIRLLGYDLEPGAARPGTALFVTLYWQALKEQKESYTSFVHLLDDKHLIWGQRDQVPGGGLSPTTGWVPGEVVADRHEVSVKRDAAPGEYTLEVGLYQPETGRRLSARASGLKVLDDGLWLGQLRLGSGG